MRCLVTGVAGFVGSTLAEELLERGHEVIGVDCFVDYYPRANKEANLLRARRSKSFRFIEGNLLQLELTELLRGVDWVFHQAAQAGVRASWGTLFATYTDNNILATQKLLEAARHDEVRKTLRRIVYASSSSVYGHAEALPTAETARPQPISPYGVTKLAAEHLCVLYAREFQVPTVSLRYFTVYGPRQRPDMAFHRFIRAALEKKPITVFDDGEQSRDFTFIADIVAANIAAAEAEFVESSTEHLVMNIGGGSRVTVNQVIEQLRKILNAPIQVQYLRREAGDAKHTSADTSRAQRFLHFTPTVSLSDGLRAEVEWIRSQLRG